MELTEFPFNAQLKMLTKLNLLRIHNSREVKLLKTQLIALATTTTSLETQTKHENTTWKGIMVIS